MEKEGDGVLRKDYLANFVSELYIQRKQTMTHLSQTSQGEPHTTATHRHSFSVKTPLLFLALLLAAASALAADITGTITCKGKGVQGVVVSDGHSFATTDKQGVYRLQSDKRNGYVFYVIPSGYMPLTEKGNWEEKLFGGFWRTLSFPDDSNMDEQHDFMLQKEKNDKHIMVFEADPQLANRKDTKDMKLYESLFLPRIKKECKLAGSTPIYSTVLGDLSWDVYWYSNKFTIADYKALIVKNHKSYGMRHFCVTGNHDNNPSTPHSEQTDHKASETFRQTVGPNYYSYNIGKVHYVVLDDVVYENTPSKDGKYKKGVVGMRDYKNGFTDEQLDWLQKDLSYVDEHTPVFVSMHVPAWYENGKFEVLERMPWNHSTQRLCQILKRFDTVHIMSGHRHQCYNMQPKQYPNIMEHSVGAVGGNLWASGGYTGHPTCVDGTPGGYQVFTINKKDISWQLRTLEGTGNEQFRIIDTNQVREYQRTSSIWQAIMKKYPSRQDFSRLPANTVLVNVFNYDRQWKVKVTEDGRELDVKQIKCEDPYAVLSYDINMYKHKKAVGEGNGTKYNTHTFMAVASRPDAEITVEVTDGFGRTYRASRQLPIACTIDAMAPTGI